jgi:hypothetical protein
MCVLTALLLLIEVFLDIVSYQFDEELLTLQVSVNQLSQHKIPDDLNLKSFSNLSLTC